MKKVVTTEACKISDKMKPRVSIFLYPLKLINALVILLKAFWIFFEKGNLILSINPVILSGAAKITHKAKIIAPAAKITNL